MTNNNLLLAYIFALAGAPLHVIEKALRNPQGRTDMLDSLCYEPPRNLDRTKEPTYVDRHDLRSPQYHPLKTVKGTRSN